MQASNFGKYTLLAHATTAGSTALTAEVDMSNFTGCEFLGGVGTTGVAMTLTIKTGASTTDTFVALSGATHATTGGSDLGVVDVYRPRERWLQCVANVATASKMMVFARQYGPRNLQSATTYDTSVVSPDT